MKYFLRTILICLFCWLSSKSFSTVMGPIKIKILGFDKSANKIYMARTDWRECDCETDLYIYNLSNDSLTVILKWAGKYDFSANSTKVIERKGLGSLAKIPYTKPSDTIVTFSWLPKVPYYDLISQTQKRNCPFRICIGDKNYEYTQCFSQSDKPVIDLFSLVDDWGLIIVNYRADCFEGNKKDEIIFYKRNSNKIISRELKPDDHLPTKDL